MSDEPKVVDLRQASVSRLLDQIGLLVEAIQASNARYVRQDREIGEMHTKIDGIVAAVATLTIQVREGFRDVRSDIVLMESRLLSAEHKASRAAEGLDPA